MDKIELREGVGVFTSGDEQVGRVNGFVLDPANNEVTHIVVQRGWLLPEDKVIPFDLITSADEEKVILSEDLDHFDDLPAFEEAHYIRPREADVDQTKTVDPSAGRPAEEGVTRGITPGYSYAPAYYWYPPQGYIGYPVGYYGWPPMAVVRNIPEDTIPLKEGIDVISADGEHVGDVERLFVDPDSNKATHFVISQGLLFKDRKLDPAHWVKSVGEDRVQLSDAAHLLEQLPSYES